jgi:hypothetical protein
MVTDHLREINCRLSIPFPRGSGRVIERVFA